jgi:protein involved in polysaccharide export with SLBB domain
LDGPVDPSEYIVGPGDLYGVSIWISPPLSLALPITPEGSIIIPTVGEIQLAGMRLSDAKKKVVTEIRKRYVSGDASFTLLAPRMFAVRVSGFGFADMTVTVQATERADYAIDLAEAKTPEKSKLVTQTTEERQKETIPGSRRKVVIQHRDGTRSRADIERYIARKESRYNPLLQDGDVVIVPAKNILRDFVGVYGAVIAEGAYEFVEGDSLISILRIARGCSPLADSGLVEVARSDEFGNAIRTVSLDLRSIVSGHAPDFALRRGDRIVVKEEVELRRDYKVRVDGEVLYPGYYPVTKDSTRLTEVIAVAGGFTDFASLSTSKIFRRSITERELASERLESARGGVTPEDSAYFYLETNVRLNREQVVADFVALFSGDKSKDVYVRDGDDIVVASKNKTIYVFGQVVAPGHVPFVPGEKFKFYVQKAGGFTQYAREGDVRIIKANTKQWLDPSETTIEGGDYVWVPKEPYRPFGYYIQVYSQAFGILGTIATLTVLVIQATK